MAAHTKRDLDLTVGTRAKAGKKLGVLK